MLKIIPSQGERGTNRMKDPGIRHLAIAVDDFDAAEAKLRAQGVNVLGDALNIRGNRLVFFTDLEGNLIHLIHREKPLP